MVTNFNGHCFNTEIMCSVGFCIFRRIRYNCFILKIVSYSCKLYNIFLITLSLRITLTYNFM